MTFKISSATNISNLDFPLSLKKNILLHFFFAASQMKFRQVNNDLCFNPAQCICKTKQLANFETPVSFPIRYLLITT